jgi:hypothetical protein
MEKDQIKDEIVKYVTAVETNYNETIRELQENLAKEKKMVKRVANGRFEETTTKNELENLFVECIEEVRKDIMKRRLKNEIYSKKKFQ